MASWGTRQNHLEILDIFKTLSSDIKLVFYKNKVFPRKFMTYKVPIKVAKVTPLGWPPCSFRQWAAPWHYLEHMEKKNKIIWLCVCCCCLVALFFFLIISLHFCVYVQIWVTKKNFVFRCLYALFLKTLQEKKMLA